ncbi:MULTISPECIES: lytic transglycosylase domain-containing protein [Mycolicibacter]|uniref:Lytic transglycosylase domain-containing protein n=2 Tax=Mycolicibacter TaxID=1073531 RepID=A0ABU5XMF5_9MYCO|nr:MULTISPECIES: lytic transglycosylase domain-containing protein [unclassified Mycolicibacter]MEB3022932.1 lytic transglycosylase domain-containing protein [Mycolicibacter sp. MYC098]MEB3034973.1 lytic transglycosylase domain-containing protein [Mycolicibacter sp. MYC340]
MTQPGFGGQPEIAYNEDEAHGVYSRAQGALSDQRQALPRPDGTGLEDPAISASLRDHHDRTSASIVDTENALGKGKRAVSDLGDVDKQSATRARGIGPGGADALARAMGRAGGPASPLTAPAGGAPAAMPAAAPMPAMPATVPAAPMMPALQPGMVNVAPDALARLVDGANLTAGPLLAGAKSGARGGKQPIAVSGIDFRQPADGTPLRKAEMHALIDKALDNNGIRDPQVRAHWHDIQYNQGMHESSGVMKAVNKDDRNAVGPVQADGAPLNCSRGPWQVTAETFARHHVGGTSNWIYDGEANGSCSVAYQIAVQAEKGLDLRTLDGIATYHARRAAANYGAY